MDERIEKLSEICCEWNRRDLDSNKAMYEIWKLFKIENLETWRKQIRTKKE